MQYSADGHSDGTVMAPQPGFLASVFRDLGVDGPADAGRAAQRRLGRPTG